jgi:hypothetical protein
VAPCGHSNDTAGAKAAGAAAAAAAVDKDADDGSLRNKLTLGARSLARSSVLPANNSPGPCNPRPHHSGPLEPLSILV